MIAIIIPANDEEALIGRCLDALRAAAQHPDLHGEAVQLVVVLDACSDRTGEIARERGALCVDIQARNVGVARAAGAEAMLAAGARWLAFSDADSAVDPDWLACQISAQADAVCGVVTVDDWHGYADAVRDAYDASYRDVEHHGHIHGASLGVSAAAYRNVGGFPSLRSSEDVALVDRLAASGALIRWTNRVRVRTSARRVSRAPAGFAGFIANLEVHGPTASDVAR